MPNQNPLLPAIAPGSGGALTTTTGPQRIATRMAENLLSVARNQEQERALAAQKRYRIGDYEFRAADHAQIQRWARMLGMEPEDVVDVLTSSEKFEEQLIEDDWYKLPVACFEMADGAIVSLVWDFASLPLTDWAWVQGLQIKSLGILNAHSESLPRLPECLHKLFCHENKLTVLDLTPVPGLQTLDCHQNQLTELDLTPVPGLQGLYCSSNQLAELDLTPVPGLQGLDCSYNSQLTKLDLTPVPGLQGLDCSYNSQLTKLDLTPVPGLQRLYCSSNLLSLPTCTNRLTELDLTPVPSLQKLYCSGNKLTKLDLTPVPGLQRLYCSGNKLTELDLTPVPGLQELDCSRNPLTELDLTPVPGLQRFYCEYKVKITNAPRTLGVSRR